MAQAFPPKGEDFYIKSATSPSGSSTSSSPQNLVVDVERGFFMTWGAIKDGSKVVVAPQKSATEHDACQLWHYDDVFVCALFQKQKNAEKLKLKSGNQAKNQRWTLTKEGRIALQHQPKFVLDVKEKNKHVELADSKSDPYVRVFCAGNNKDIIAQTKVIDNNLNPVWNEVHYLPVKGIGEKFMFEVMDFNTFIKDRPLGNHHFEVTRELAKELPDGTYEGTPNGIDVAKFFPLEPLPKPTPDFLANLKEKPFDRSTFYNLITLQAPNGGFPPSDKLANLFGFESQDQLLELYKRQCREDRILKHDPTDYRSEWGGVYERAEQYISKAVNDLEIEETVVATGRKAVRERFDIKIDNDPKTKRLTRETISITHIKRLLKCQQSTGAYQINDDFAKSLGYENMDKLRIAFNEYKDKKSKSQKISQVSLQTWMTMLMLYFYRYVAIDQRKEWYHTYEKSYRWVWAQLKGNESLEQECFEIVKSFIKECHDVKDEVLESDRAFEGELSEMINSIKHPQKERGIAQKPHGIARIEIICAKNLKQADSWSGSSASDP
ncbi:7209_t:CDS:2, partial [Racocetra fulgida]